MTAPTRTRRQPEDPARTGTTREAVREPTRTERHAGTRSGQRSTARSTAAERAYARRAQRVDLMRRNGSEAHQKKQGGLRLRWPKSRASFVLIVMTLLVAGVVATLLLSTQAIADSYRLEQIREENSNLAEQSEQLQQGVTRNESASVLAERAKALGMVPAGDPAHLVLNADGSVTVVGDPKKAQAPAPPVTHPPAATPPATPQNQQNQPPNQPQNQNQPPNQAQNPPPQNQAQPPAGATAPIEGDVAQGDQQQPPVVSARGGH